MSGGTFDYIDSRLKNEIFGYSGEFNNALEDLEISKLVWDVLDLLHNFDWYKAGDTDEDSYKEAMKKFKEKWFVRPRAARLHEYIDEVFNKSRAECMSMIGDVDAAYDSQYEKYVHKYGEYVDKSTAADILQVTRATVYAMLADGRLLAGHQGKRVSMHSIVNYMVMRGVKL